MPALDIGSIATAAADAVQTLGVGIRKEVWERLVGEMRMLGARIADIGNGLISGHFHSDDAKFFLERQIMSIKALFFGVAEITLTLVQDAIDTVLAAVRGVVNAAVKSATGISFL